MAVLQKLTARQDKALGALLSSPSIEAAGQACKVGVRTIHRWLQDDPVFQDAYREARRQVVQQAITQVQQATSTAVQTLLAVMQDAEAPASAKVSAARTILETAVKAVELEDLEARLAALEAHGHGQPL